MMMKRLTGWFVASLLWSVTAFSQSATSNAIVVVEAKQTDLQPQASVIYTLAIGTNVYHSTGPGPCYYRTAEAWSFANEFVARTALRHAFALPAESAGGSKQYTNVFVVTFSSLTNGPRLILLVNRDERTVRLEKTK